MRVRDDVGRNPLHDACWTKEPSLDLVRMILEREPDLAILADRRGHTPLGYVRAEHWRVWDEFLDTFDEKALRPKIL